MRLESCVAERLLTGEDLLLLRQTEAPPWGGIRRLSHRHCRGRKKDSRRSGAERGGPAGLTAISVNGLLRSGDLVVLISLLPGGNKKVTREGKPVDFEGLIGGRTR